MPDVDYWNVDFQREIATTQFAGRDFPLILDEQLHFVFRFDSPYDDGWQQLFAGVSFVVVERALKTFIRTLLGLLTRYRSRTFTEPVFDDVAECFGILEI